jgi:hypothetical protein
MEQCSETSVHKIQTPGNHPKEGIQHSGRGESLKSGSTRNVMKTNLLILFRGKNVVHVRAICKVNTVRTNVVCVVVLIKDVTSSVLYCDKHRVVNL